MKEIYLPKDVNHRFWAIFDQYLTLLFEKKINLTKDVNSRVNDVTCFIHKKSTTNPNKVNKKLTSKFLKTSETTAIINEKRKTNQFKKQFILIHPVNPNKKPHPHIPENHSSKNFFMILHF